MDAPLLTENVMTENQIIRMVSAELDTECEATIPDSEKENEESPPTSVSITEALNALHIQFQEQQEDDKGFKPNEVRN